MRTIDEYDYRERLNRFRELLAVTKENVVVTHIAQLYAKGDIVTFDEALHQIILRLTAEYSRQQADLYRAMQMIPGFRLGDSGIGL